MKKITLVAALALLALGVRGSAWQAGAPAPAAPPAAAAPSGPAADVLDLEKKIEAAVVKGDVKFVDGVLAKDFSFVHGDGWTVGGQPLASDDRAAFLKRVTDKQYWVHDLDRVQVEMHGDVAITYGRYVSLSLPQGVNGNPGALNSIWFERVYAKRNGQWQFVSHRTVHGPLVSPAGVDPTMGEGPVPWTGPALAARNQGTGNTAMANGGAAAAGKKAKSADEIEILGLDQKIANAVVAGQVDYVRSVTPADFSMVHGDGWIHGGKPLLTDTQATLLKRVETKAYALIEFDSMNAEMHDDIAITYGRYVAMYPTPADPNKKWFSVWFERVFQKREGKWIYLSHRTVHGPQYGPDRESVSKLSIPPQTTSRQ